MTHHVVVAKGLDLKARASYGASGDTNANSSLLCILDTHIKFVIDERVDGMVPDS